MKINHLFSAFVAGSMLVYSMMLFVGVQPDTSVSSAPPRLVNIPHLDDAQKNTVSEFAKNNAEEYTGLNSQPAAGKPIGRTENITINKIKADFFNKKINSIGRDEQGNYVVNISSANEQPILIQSSTPIYYPTETDLNYGVKGCVLGGYYIELNHQIALITQEDTTKGTTKAQHNYRCDYNNTTNSYMLNDR